MFFSFYILLHLVFLVCGNFICQRKGPSPNWTDYEPLGNGCDELMSTTNCEQANPRLEVLKVLQFS